MPKISILMALYHPNPEWLAQQLQSLEAQTWPELALDVRDDGPDAPLGAEFFARHLCRIPFRYAVNETNLGTTATYARLVGSADGDYIAFCDQDDRWDAPKLELLAAELQRKNAQAAYCTLRVIDGEGRPTAADVRSVRKGDVFLQGEAAAPQLLIKNSIYGCSLLLRADTARRALPVPEGMGFDHWFTLWAALCGTLVFVDRPLVEYRIHGGNQSRPLRGITTRRQYEERRIGLLEKQMTAVLPRLQAVPAPGRAEPVEKKAREALTWARARRAWLHRDPRALPAFIRGRALSPRAFRFELLLPFLPPHAASALLRRISAE